MKTSTPRPIRLKDYQPPHYLIDHVDLDIRLDPRHTLVRSKLKLRLNAEHDEAATKPANRTRPAKRPLELDGENLDLMELKLDGEPLAEDAYHITPTGLVIKNPPQESFTLETTVAVNPEDNKALQGLYLSRGIYCTQCEAQGFRRITYFLDRPDVLATYKVRVEAPAEAASVLLSNGNLVEKGTLKNGKNLYAVWKDPHPKPCYLFALVGGNLASIASDYKTASGKSVELAIYVEPGKEDRAGWAMESLKRSMAWDEKRFGREYDLDVFNIVAVSHFNMGAMENKGLNIFNDRLILASPDKATDTSYEAIESVVAHEYFHNWTGNRITCRDWFQLCLKEGLTVYRDQEFSGEERSATVQRIRDVRQLKAHQFPEDAGPLAHPVRPESYIEINNFYTATVYEKGAELVRMIATILGEAAFRKGMDLYFERHDGDAATVEDFLVCFEDAAGTDLSQFRLWYSQAGTPHLSVKTHYDAGRQRLTLDLVQETSETPGQKRKKPFHIPIRFALLNDAGEEVKATAHDKSGEPIGDIIHLREKRQKVFFEDIAEPPHVSVLRNFSAPVILKMDRADSELEFLARNDTDGYNRWDALNRLSTRTLIRRVEALARKERCNEGANVADALADCLASPDLEDGFKAELLRLPNQADIAREIGHDVDPGLIFKAHRQFQAFIARRLSDPLLEIYQACETEGAFSASAEAVGKRALRNACLTLLAARRTEADRKLALRHYKRAATMTDAAHALFIIAGFSPAEHKPVLDHFYRKWKKDHLVIDTWFAAIGQMPRAGALAAVKKAMKDPVFDLYTPNKVRALIGAFAMQNQAQFHRPDGQGYVFFVDIIKQIDSFNPQLAARLLGALGAWRSLEAGRRKLALKQLKQLAKKKDLSRDTFEMVSRLTQEQ